MCSVSNLYPSFVSCSKLGSLLQCAFYGSTGRMTLFEQRNFAGRRFDLSSGCHKLSDKNFSERCNSAQVQSGLPSTQYRSDMFLLIVTVVACVRILMPSSQVCSKPLCAIVTALMCGFELFVGSNWQEPNYRGEHYILEKKDYMSFSDWGAPSSTMGSMRRVRFS
uniref:Crystallin beta gamma X n=1 Tax=Electrophorus electricus TaxID=8005 RepID=A0A4W4H2G3_ELEEL